MQILKHLKESTYEEKLIVSCNDPRGGSPITTQPLYSNAKQKTAAILAPTVCPSHHHMDFQWLSNTSSNISKSGWATNHRRHTRPAQRCSWWYPQFTSASCVRLSSGSHCLGTNHEASIQRISLQVISWLSLHQRWISWRVPDFFCIEMAENHRTRPDANINFAEKTHANISNTCTHDITWCNQTHLEASKTQ